MPGLFEEQLDLYLRARCTLLVVVTLEEERALRGVRAACGGTRRDCVAWDVAEGFQTPGGGPPLPAARDPLSALEQIDRAEGDALFVLKDFHDCWADAAVRRRLRN